MVEVINPLFIFSIVREEKRTMKKKNAKAIPSVCLHIRREGYQTKVLLFSFLFYAFSLSLSLFLFFNLCVLIEFLGLL